MKQLEVIGARGRNWPIRDGKDQVRLIATHSAMPTEEQPASGLSTRRSTTSDGSKGGRSHASSTSATGDPHASLSLFAPREHDEDGFSTPKSSAVMPRASARPPNRDLAEILAGNEEAEPDTPTAAIRSPSPIKNGASKNYARIGSNKHFHAVRLFDENEEQPRPGSPEKSAVKTNEKKYKHFEFGEGEDAPATSFEAEMAKKSKHASQWDFEDFVTPNNQGAKVRKQDQRNFGWSDDEVSLLDTHVILL